MASSYDRLPSGFGGINWGDPPDGSLVLAGKELGTDFIKDTKIYRKSAEDNCPFQPHPEIRSIGIFYLFKNNRLYQVMQLFQPSATLFDKLRNVLIAIYGPAQGDKIRKRDGEPIRRALVSWRDKGNLLTLRYSDTERSRDLAILMTNMTFVEGIALREVNESKGSEASQPSLKTPPPDGKSADSGRELVTQVNAEKAQANITEPTIPSRSQPSPIEAVLSTAGEDPINIKLYNTTVDVGENGVGNAKVDGVIGIQVILPRGMNYRLDLLNPDQLLRGEQDIANLIPKAVAIYKKVDNYNKKIFTGGPGIAGVGQNWSDLAYTPVKTADAGSIHYAIIKFGGEPIKVDFSTLSNEIYLWLRVFEDSIRNGTLNPGERIIDVDFIKLHR